MRDEMLLGQSFNYIPIIEKVVKVKVDKDSYLMSNNDGAMYMFLVFENDIEIEEKVIMTAHS